MTPREAYDHCAKNGKNAELEKIVLTDPEWAYYYARDIIKGRWIEGEKIILTDPYWAYRYALEIINGRWIEAENIILTDPGYSYLYAREVIKGKLPENMHNMMLLHADVWAKRYLNFINKLKPSV